jgi:hypothetical protein
MAGKLGSRSVCVISFPALSPSPKKKLSELVALLSKMGSSPEVLKGWPDQAYSKRHLFFFFLQSNNLSRLQQFQVNAIDCRPGHPPTGEDTSINPNPTQQGTKKKSD